MITITLETVDHRSVKVTGRRDGKTVTWYRVWTDKAQKTVKKVAREIACGHCVNGQYDPKFVQFNPAALAALNEATIEMA